MQQEKSRNAKFIGEVPSIGVDQLIRHLAAVFGVRVVTGIRGKTTSLELDEPMSKRKLDQVRGFVKGYNFALEVEMKESGSVS